MRNYALLFIAIGVYCQIGDQVQAQTDSLPQPQIGDGAKPVSFKNTAHWRASQLLSCGSDTVPMQVFYSSYSEFEKMNWNSAAGAFVPFQGTSYEFEYLCDFGSAKEGVEVSAQQSSDGLDDFILKSRVFYSGAADGLKVALYDSGWDQYDSYTLEVTELGHEYVTGLEVMIDRDFSRLIGVTVDGQCYFRLNGATGLLEERHLSTCTSTFSISHAGDKLEIAENGVQLFSFEFKQDFKHLLKNLNQAISITDQARLIIDGYKR